MKISPQTALYGAETTRSLRRMVVPVDMTIEDVLVPANWSHVFAKVAERDEIIIEPEDDAWRLHVRVMERGTGWVRLFVLSKHEFHVQKKTAVISEADTPDVPEGYKVNFAPRTLWRVVLVDSSITVSQNHKSRYDAVMAAIAEHAKANAQIAA